jgi:hypothetical protein
LDLNLNTVNASIIIYPNATFMCQPPLVISPDVTASFYGLVCNTETIEVHGTMFLTDTGTTCDSNIPGKFKLSNIIIYAGGKVQTLSPVNLDNTYVCLHRSALFNTSDISNYISLSNGIIFFISFYLVLINSAVSDPLCTIYGIPNNCPRGSVWNGTACSSMSSMYFLLFFIIYLLLFIIYLLLFIIYYLFLKNLI